MKKAILFIACFAVLFISLSAFTDRAIAPTTGYKAPELRLTNGTATVAMSSQGAGKYTILNFWSTADAQSRLKCNIYSAFAGAEDNLNFVAVNFDSNADLFREILRRDGLSASTQYHVEGKEATKIQDLYHLSDGLKSFLINPEGRIIAVDPDIEQVTRLI